MRAAPCRPCHPSEPPPACAPPRPPMPRHAAGPTSCSRARHCSSSALRCCSQLRDSAATWMYYRRGRAAALFAHLVPACVLPGVRGACPAPWAGKQEQPNTLWAQTGQAQYPGRPLCPPPKPPCQPAPAPHRAGRGDGRRGRHCVGDGRGDGHKVNGIALPCQAVGSPQRRVLAGVGAVHAYQDAAPHAGRALPAGGAASGRWLVSLRRRRGGLRGAAGGRGPEVAQAWGGKTDGGGAAAQRSRGSALPPSRC